MRFKNQCGHCPELFFRNERRGFSNYGRRPELIACHTRSGLAGMSKWLMPSGRSASTMAFITEVIDPAHPASPQPFAPTGLVVAGPGWLLQSIDAWISSARGSA